MVVLCLGGLAVDVGSLCWFSWLVSAGFLGLVGSIVFLFGLGGGGSVMVSLCLFHGSCILVFSLLESPMKLS